MTDNDFKNRITNAEMNTGDGKRVVFRLPDGTVYYDAHPHVAVECYNVNGREIKEEILMIDLSKWDN